jgi:two-component system chemotaxis response regulator CheB
MKPRVLIIDDSASSRAALASLLEAHGCDVIGRAMDGGHGLSAVMELAPDVVTLDLEMPRIDGYTFLRILAQQKPTPVIVVTSDARPESALQALELGARDFVVKPSGGPRELQRLGEMMALKIHALAEESHRVRDVPERAHVTIPPRCHLIVIGASTGGPRALRDIVGAIPRGAGVPVVIAQHMPPRFTAAFADRLCRQTGHDVREAVDGESLIDGVVRVIPGGRHGSICRRDRALTLSLDVPTADERHVPSVDRLLTSAAQALSDEVLGVVLTGMGRDGALGAAALAHAGATLWVESSATAVVDGMPVAAARAHGAAKALPVDELARLVGRVVARSGPLDET